MVYNCINKDLLLLAQPHVYISTNFLWNGYTNWRIWLTDIFHIKHLDAYGSGHEGVAVLLPGFAIIWSLSIWLNNSFINLTWVYINESTILMLKLFRFDAENGIYGRENGTNNHNCSHISYYISIMISSYLWLVQDCSVSYTQVSHTPGGLRSIYLSLGMRQLFGDVTMILTM